MEPKLSRRDLIGRGAAFGALAVFGAGACSKPKAALSCMDTSGMAAPDLALRNSAAVTYLDLAAESAKTCSKCAQFLPAAPDACGTCKVIKGPINPNGGCKLFAPKPA